MPEGYTAKSIAPASPNNNFTGFTKSLTRRIASSLGISYNHLLKDYSDVNYSSLRQAKIDQDKTYQGINRFFQENWKNRQYIQWLKSYLIHYNTRFVRASMYQDLIRCFTFTRLKSPYFDVVKDITAVSKKMQLGLTNPLIELDSMGLDADEVLQGFSRWQKMLEKYGIRLPQYSPQDQPVSSDQDQINNDKSNKDNGK